MHLAPRERLAVAVTAGLYIFAFVLALEDGLSWEWAAGLAVPVVLVAAPVYYLFYERRDTELLDEEEDREEDEALGLPVEEPVDPDVDGLEDVPPRAGAPPPQSRWCPTCYGYTRGSDARICVHCGRRLPPREPAPPLPRNPAPPA
jgi:hypothetical protein